MVDPWKGDPAEERLLREASVKRLVRLHERGELDADQVRLVAVVLRKSVRTVWRWVAHESGQRKSRAKFELDAELRERYAYHRGNVAALHRELAAQAAAAGTSVVSVDTLERAVNRAVSPGDKAGLRTGERARRRSDVYLRRPAAYRNSVWEGDHVEASVRVDVDGTPRKPWVTWFIDCGTDAIMGAAITPSYPTRESVLVALRASISRAEGFGPFGGLPGAIRVDRGRDFLSKAVASAMAVFGVQIIDLPGYMPHLKGRIEAVNGAVKTQKFAELPGYTEAPTLANNKPADSNPPLLTFEAFVAEVLDWITWWNTEHTLPALGGRTPLEAWQSDPTPIEDVDEQDLALFTLEDDGRERHISTGGVSFMSRSYVGAWMVGHVGTAVRVRWLPNHPQLIEVFNARTGAHLGSAYPSDEASKDQRKALIATRARKSKQLVAELRSVERKRNVRYAAATKAAPPKTLGSVGELQAEVELAEARDARTKARARPDLFELRPAAASWAVPRRRPPAPPASDPHQETEEHDD